MGHKRQSEIVVGVTSSQKVAFQHQYNELQNLGISLKELAVNDWPQSSVDICIIPSEVILSASPSLVSRIQQDDVPFIISLNTQAAELSVIDTVQKAVGFMYGEPSVYQFALELELGMHLHRERKFNRRRVEHTATKIQNNRTIGVATGLLMAKTNMNSLEVFNTLKVFSRNHQIRISSVAEKIISIHEQKVFSVKDVASDLGVWLVDNVNIADTLSSRRVEEQQRRIS